jgi:hypothetical protein
MMRASLPGVHPHALVSALRRRTRGGRDGDTGLAGTAGEDTSSTARCTVMAILSLLSEGPSNPLNMSHCAAERKRHTRICHATVELRQRPITACNHRLRCVDQTINPVAHFCVFAHLFAQVLTFVTSSLDSLFRLIDLRAPAGERKEWSHHA